MICLFSCLVSLVSDLIEKFLRRISTIKNPRRGGGHEKRQFIRYRR